MSWQKYNKEVVGILVNGDPNVPQTRWWNHLWLLIFGWQLTAVIDVRTHGPFMVGFRDFRGKTMICTQRMNMRRFRVKVGREPCFFFAVNEDGREIEINEIARVHKNDPRYTYAPMI